jgi:enamine deaminase RidA (YjgF/YER057c/UK114 family)
MDRTEINPWPWSTAFGFSQAVKVSGVTEWLICSGQTTLDDDGAVPAAVDMASQVTKAFENLGTVLASGGMTPADVVRVNYYTTDVDELIAVLGPAAAAFFGSTLPSSTLLGVSRLAFPELKLEIEVTAAR